MSRWNLAPLLMAALIGCTGDVEDTQPTWTDPVDSDVPERDRCVEPLALSPAEVSVEAADTLTFEVSGGSGEVRFALRSAPSGGLVSPLLGTYYAGETTGVTDEVVAVDEVCGTEVSASVAVYDVMTVAPAKASVLPGTTMTLAVDGGSGGPLCTLFSTASGASLAGCTYTAGADTGPDVIEVSDPLTGRVVRSEVQVSPDAQLALYGERLVIPLGASLAVAVSNGSGDVSVTVSAGALQQSGGRLSATEVGSGVLTLEDTFTGASVDVAYRVVPSFSPDIAPDGELSIDTRMLGLGDADDDGYDDFAVARYDAHHGAIRSGVVHVYTGGPDGPASEPAQTLAGYEANENLGVWMASADVDGDGVADLLLGSRGASSYGAASRGTVAVHLGLNGGLFEETASWTWDGPKGGDFAGDAFTVCDVNDDGWVDLIAGAFGADRPGTSVSATGGLYVLHGGPGGFSDVPDQAVYALVPATSATWLPEQNLQLGRTIASGDITGDGVCDIAVTAWSKRWTPESRGVVYVYEGSKNGLLARPSRILMGDDASKDTFFGRWLEVADLDANGRSEVLVGSYRNNQLRSNGGAVLVFPGAERNFQPHLAETAADAAFVVGPADSSFDYFGHSFSVGDLDGDGASELIVGTLQEDMPGGEPREGSAYVFDGTWLRDALSTGGAGLYTTDEAVESLAGLEERAYFGQSVAAIGDVDGDGTGDVGVYAGRAAGLGVKTSLVHWQGADGVLGTLGFPVTLTGGLVGGNHSLGVADVGNDGVDDVLIGVLGAGNERGSNAGELFAAPIGEDGQLGEAAADFGRFARHSDSDELGGSVTSAGDFDGDGVEDIWVVARREAQVANWPGAYNRAGCTGANLGQTGAAFLYSGGDVASAPLAAWYGNERNDQLRVALGGFDHNGDGFDDSAFGSWLWQSSRGGLGLVYGRAGELVPTTLLCDAWEVSGSSGGDWFGESLAAADFDGDGCDDLVAGASRDDLGESNQGAVRVLWGFGEACGSDTAQVTTLVPGLRDLWAGSAVATGMDVGGDGVPDLITGAEQYTLAGQRLGAVFVTSGARLAGLPRQDMPGGQLPAEASTMVHLLTDNDARDLFVGEWLDGGVGGSLALVPDPDGGPALIAVGVPGGDLGGTAGAGGVVVMRFDAVRGWLDVPAMVVVGDSTSPGGQLGEGLFGTGRGGGLLLVGAPTSSRVGAEQGSLFVVPLGD